MKDHVGVFAFIFDSGRLGASFYGEVVFRYMMQGKELTQNPIKMVVSLGDLFTKGWHVDIEPYVLKDQYCSIDFDALNLKNPFLDYPFCWIVENLSPEIALSIDRRLKGTLEGYVGLSRIETAKASQRQQFWKQLIRDFAVFQTHITCFQNPEEVGTFAHSACAAELGYTVDYDVDAGYEMVQDDDALQTNAIQAQSDLETNGPKRKDVERDLTTLNFALRQELQIAGVLIWRSINDIDKVCFRNENESNNQLIEYPFLTLYHASQGIERLQKAIVELICKKNHISEGEKEKVYDLLMSHSHNRLNDWIAAREKIVLSRDCKKMLSILERFYSTIRYVRFSDEGCSRTTAPEYPLLLELSNKNSADLNKEIKNRFGRRLGELCTAYFSLYCELCAGLNIYADEIEYNSAAMRVLCKKPINLYEELKRQQGAKKELLYWIMKNAQQYPKIVEMDEDPLDFDSGMVEQYLSELIYNAEDGMDLFDEVDNQYDELCYADKEQWKKRIRTIEFFIDKIL